MKVHGAEKGDLPLISGTDRESGRTLQEKPVCAPAGISFAREKFLDVQNELAYLISAHYEEIAHYQDIELDPDWPRYEELEKLGSLRIYTARKNGTMLGYAVYIVNYNLHFRKSFQAAQDVLFISKENRGFGKVFIAWCDDRLRQDGVQVVFQHVNSSHNFGPMLEKIGYELIDFTYGRRLD